MASCYSPKEDDCSHTCADEPARLFQQHGTKSIPLPRLSGTVLRHLLETSIGPLAEVALYTREMITTY